MAKSRFKIEGIKELQHALKELPKEMKKVIRESTKEASQNFARELRADFEVDTGETIDSIKVRAMKRSRKSIGYMATIDTPYAGSVEYGTEEIEGRGSGRHSFQKNVETQAKGLENNLLKGMERETNKLRWHSPK